MGRVRGARSQDRARLPGARREVRRVDDRARLLTPTAAPPVVRAWRDPSRDARTDALVTLALDQGSHSSRAVLFDAIGTRGRAAHVPVGTRREGADRVEQDPEELLHSLRTAALRRLRVAGGRRVCRSRRPGSRPSARPIAVLGPQQRTRADRRDLLAGSSQRRLARPAAAARRAGARDHGAAAVAALRREQAALVPRPRTGRAARRRSDRYLVGGPAVELPRRSGSCTSRPARRGSGERVAHAAARSRRRSTGRPTCSACSRSRASTCHGACRRWHAVGTLVLAARRMPLAACTGDQSAAAFAFGTTRPVDRDGQRRHRRIRAAGRAGRCAAAGRTAAQRAVRRRLERRAARSRRHRERRWQRARLVAQPGRRSTSTARSRRRRRATGRARIRRCS